MRKAQDVDVRTAGGPGGPRSKECILKRMNLAIVADVDEQTRRCVDRCRETYEGCQVAIAHILEGDGQGKERQVRLLTDCAEICETCASFLLRRSGRHAIVCRACADICDAVSGEFGTYGDELMAALIDICRECAKACKDMLV